MKDKETLRIFTNGGIVSPEELRKIIQVAQAGACSTVLSGCRQELYLQIEKEYLATAEEVLENNAIRFALLADSCENIMTSFAALQILPTTAWLLGDTYLDILDSFTYQPKLKINIVDPLQNLVPLFTGELNFIASSYPRYWHLYVNIASFGKRQVWPVLIDGDDIGSLSKLIEQVYVEEQPDSVHDLYLAVSQKFTGRTRQWEEELHLPAHAFPILEGIHPYGNSCWLGIYRRNQSYPLSFLKALYDQCIESKIGNICLTPYKTLLIKDIKAEESVLWKKLMGLHQIHNHHSALELNWQLPDLDQDTQQLKNAWVKELEEKEAYTVGLSCAIQTKPMDIAASIIIKQTTGASHVFDILHTTDFSTHSLQCQVFAENVSEQAVVATIIDLCQLYYTQADQSALSTFWEEKPVIIPIYEVYQCPDCLTIYNPEYGDSAANIPAGISFEELPQTYTCSLCEAPKQIFVAVEKGEAPIIDHQNT